MKTQLEIKEGGTYFLKIREPYPIVEVLKITTHNRWDGDISVVTFKVVKSGAGFRKISGSYELELEDFKSHTISSFYIDLAERVKDARKKMMTSKRLMSKGPNGLSAYYDKDKTSLAIFGFDTCLDIVMKEIKGVIE